jgi:integrase
MRSKKKPFGKINLKKPHQIRDWEVYFGIKYRKGPSAWKSKYTSVQKLLRHLKRYTQSEGTRCLYLRILYRFCKYSRKNPDKLIEYDPDDASDMVQDFVDELGDKKYSRAYLNSILRKLQTFYKTNKMDIKVQTYFVSSRYRKKPEYIPSKDEIYNIADAADSLRNRAIILILWTSGIRVSTLCALNYEDVEEDIESGKEYIKIPIYPEMKERVPDACKGGIPYYTFISSEASDVLIAYIRERIEQYNDITSKEPLICSEWNQYDKKVRKTKRLAPQTINKNIKKAARLAGIEQGEYVSAHCLRKAFESILRAPTVEGGNMDISTQQFLFGHILPGTQDPYYDRTKVNFHREIYSKLNFARSPMESKFTDILLASVRAASTGVGADPEKIIADYAQAKYGKEILWRLFPQDDQVKLIQEAMEWKREHVAPIEEAKDKVISTDFLEKYLSKGWKFVEKLDNRRCVIRKRK